MRQQHTWALPEPARNNAERRRDSASSDSSSTPAQMTKWIAKSDSQALLNAESHSCV